MRVLAVVNFKGGTGKTNTAAWVLHALAEAGLDVFGIDADPQGSMVKWAKHASWRLPVAHVSSGALGHRVEGIAGTRDVVVIDAPPLELQRRIVLSAIQAATHVLVPVGPSPIEYEEVEPIRQVIADADSLRGRPATTAVLVTRVKPGTRSYLGMREQLLDDGWPVLDVHVPMLEQFNLSYGQPIQNASATPYADAAEELFNMETRA